MTKPWYLRRLSRRRRWWFRLFYEIELQVAGILGFRWLVSEH